MEPMLVALVMADSMESSTKSETVLADLALGFPSKFDTQKSYFIVWGSSFAALLQES